MNRREFIGTTMAVSVSALIAPTQIIAAKAVPSAREWGKTTLCFGDRLIGEIHLVSYQQEKTDCYPGHPILSGMVDVPVTKLFLEGAFCSVKQGDCEVRIVFPNKDYWGCPGIVLEAAADFVLIKVAGKPFFVCQVKDN